MQVHGSLGAVKTTSVFKWITIIKNSITLLQNQKHIERIFPTWQPKMLYLSMYYAIRALQSICMFH